MRYLNSAAFLLLTASSSVSLLSSAAKAAQEVPGVAETASEVQRALPSTPRTIAQKNIQKVAPKLTTLPLLPSDSWTEFAATTVESSVPIVSVPTVLEPAPEISSAQPQFDRLRERLWDDKTQPAVEASRQADSQIVAIEVISSDAEASSSSALPAPNDKQNNSPDDLPVLEEGETPTPIDVAEPTADPNLPTTDPLDIPAGELPSPPADTPSDDSTAEELERLLRSPARDTPTRGTGVNGLPDSLFSDPNPLSFPTQTEEIDVDQNPVVTLEEAVELAYQNNQVLQQAQLSLEQADAALAAQEAARLPTVSTSANLTNVQDEGSRTTLGGSVEVSYDLLTGGSRGASIRAAQLQQEVSALALEAQQEQIRLTTATAYYALQESGEQIRINQSFLDEAARNLRDAQLRQDVGVGTKFDTLRAEVQFANARQSLIQSQGNQRIARRDIARVLNLPPTTGLTATPVAVEETWPLTLEESILLAFQNRAELEQQLLQADISEQQRQIALAAVRPRLSVFANYGLQNILQGATAFEDDFQDNVSVGARFNWTLYDGGAARANARQQEIAGMIAEEQFSENLDQVRFDVEQAYFNLQTNQENILTSQVAVAQAEEALALANLRLQAGVGTQLDVLTAQRELTEAQVNNVTAILGYNRARVSIERAISNVVTAF